MDPANRRQQARNGAAVTDLNASGATPGQAQLYSLPHGLTSFSPEAGKEGSISSGSLYPDVGRGVHQENEQMGLYAAGLPLAQRQNIAGTPQSTVDRF